MSNPKTPKTVPVESQTIDLESGEVVETRTTHWTLKPPPETACQTCGHNPAHQPDEPHNKQSFYYQYAFYGEHKRWPTWKDAMAHCDPETQQKWEQQLRQMGKWS